MSTVNPTSSIGQVIDVVIDAIKTPVTKTFNYVLENHPYALAAVGATTFVATVATAKNARDKSQIKTTLNDLLITEFHLPTKLDLFYGSTFGKIFGKAKSLQKPVLNAENSQEIKLALQKITTSLKRMHQASPPNLIIEGNSGVGKKMLAQYLCLEAGIGYIHLPAASMESLINNGNHIVALEEILKTAEACPVPVCIIMNAGEGLVAARQTNQKAKTDDSQSDWSIDLANASETGIQKHASLVNTLLATAEKAGRKVSFFVTTQDKNKMDSAFKSRATALTISDPQEDERTKIISQHVPLIFNSNEEHVAFFHKGRISEIAQKTEGFTGRDLHKMLEQVAGSVRLNKGKINKSIIDACILNVGKTLPKRAATTTEASAPR